MSDQTHPDETTVERYREFAGKQSTTVTIWQLSHVQNEMRGGYLDGDPSDAEAVAQHLRPVQADGSLGDAPSVEEIAETARQLRDYHRTYNKR